MYLKMFQIKKEKFGKYTKVKLINSETKEYVSIIPEFGGNINEIVLSLRGVGYDIIDGSSTCDELVANEWFKSAKLIPFPNRINNGEYHFLGKKYNLPINFPKQNHAIHGLIYNKKFNIVKISKSRRGVSLCLNKKFEGFLGYPFCLDVSMTYYLTTKGFECKTVVKNCGADKIPFGDGWHPYIKSAGKVDNFYLSIPSNKRVVVNKKMIPTGKIMPFQQQSNKIGQRKFDTGFKLNKNKGIATTEIYNKKENVKICVWQETGKNKYNYLQIFIPPARQSIAVEPMTGNTDAFNNKDGLIVLKPKSVYKASYGIYLK